MTENLRRWIVQGRLVPGQRLTEDWLAEQFEVSRVPVREATRRLAAEGFVVHTRHLGAVVAQLSQEEANGLLRLRAVVEEFIVGEAVAAASDDDLVAIEAVVLEAENALRQGDDPEVLPDLNSRFHIAVAAASGNSSAQQVLTLLEHKIAWVYGLHVTRRLQDRAAWVEHRGIYEAIAARDTDGACALIRRHIEATRESYEEF